MKHLRCRHPSGLLNDNASRGFTLIEVLAALVIVALLTAVAGLGIVQIARGFVITHESGEIALKSDFVLTRFRKSVRNLTGINTANGTTLAMTRVDEDGNPVSETFAFDNNTLRLGDEDLMTGISGSFSYFDEAGDDWDFNTDDLGSLAAVRIFITMQGPEGSSLNFSGEILPRNTFTPDQAYSPSQTGTTAAQGLCLVETLYPDSPLVWRLFRDVRDNRLKEMPMGRSVIRAYYSAGSGIKKFLKDHPPARYAAGWAAAPVVAVVFFWQHFPAGLAALLAAAWIMGRMAARLLVHGPRILSGTSRHRRMAGSILLSLAITMTILAILGGALISVLNTAQGTGASTALGEQAYYYAESGLRYAMSQFVGNQNNDGNFIAALSPSSGEDRFAVTSTGGFELDARCFYFEPVDSTTLQSFGEDFPDEILSTMTSGASGRLQFVDTNGDGTVVDVIISDISDGADKDTITYSGSVATAAYALPVATVDLNQTDITAADFGVDKAAGTIRLNTSGFMGCFPNVRGLVSFMADADSDGSYDDEVFLIYERRSGNTLSDLRNVPGKPPLPAGGVDIADGTDVVLGRYARLESTGVVAAGTSMESRANLTLHQPLDVAEFMKMIYNAEAAEQHAESVLGQHAWNDDEGALEVTETEDTYFVANNVDVNVQESLAAYDWDAVWDEGFLRDLWERSDRKLSYEAQVKVKFTENEDDIDTEPANHPGHYMPGLAFRLISPDGNAAGATFYGMSFVRGLQGTTTTSSGSGCGGAITASDDDDVPDNLYAGNGSNENNITSQCEDSDFTPTEWNDDPMLDGIPYLLFWQKYIEEGDYGCGSSANNSPFEWLSYMPLVEVEKTTIYRYDDNVGASVYGGSLLGGAWDDHQADFPVGQYTLSECEALGMENDDIEAVTVEPGFRITLYIHDNFGGESLVLTEGNHNLYNYDCDNCGWDGLLVGKTWANDVSSLIVEYADSDLSLGWYDGQVGSFTPDDTYTAWKLTDKYNLFKTHPYEGDEDVQTLGLPGAVAIMDSSTVNEEGGPYPIQDAAYIVPPNNTEQSYKRDLNYRLYLREWVTVGLQIFELEGDLDCNTSTGDVNGEERINAVSAFFGAPGDTGENSGSCLKDGSRQGYEASTPADYYDYPVKWLEDRAYFTKAVWDGLGISDDVPVVSTDGGYTSMMVDNPYPTGGCMGNADQIKLVEKGRDADNDPTIVYTGTFVTQDYQSFFDDTGISVPEIGLHTLGISSEASAGEDDRETAYFKDWYWRFFQGGHTGMIPGIVSE
ncbi:MAG: prepilin-type N-terminal cleavage/methylation domain-containing protein [Thermodesulfobacteriota bacterium]|nr:prepilin-type N-terminal cleavage/methylation domain-containing protein [Thermodesulfobacteriota bacterium]